jgi:CheY-like chemotaxis protein
MQSSHLGDPDSSPQEPRVAERILVVEDEANVRTLVVGMLTACGYDVLEAASAEEALGHFGSSRFDLMITDNAMPGADGPTLARAAVVLQPRLPVLFISGNPPQTLPNLVIEGSATGFLAKPFAPDELTRLVRSLLDRTAAPHRAL